MLFTRSTSKTEGSRKVKNKGKKKEIPQNTNLKEFEYLF